MMHIIDNYLASKTFM